MILKIQSFGMGGMAKTFLLSTFEYLMTETNPLIKKAEFNIDEFPIRNEFVTGYSIELERLSNETHKVQWQATFSKDGETMMTSIGQVEK